MDIRWSSSTIKVYKSCPFRFYCKITKQKQDTDTDQSYGQAGNVVHHALEYYFQNLLEIPLDLALVELRNTFDEEWEYCKLINPVIKKEVYWLCVINGIKLGVDPTDLEHEFRIHKDGINFIGYADVMNTKEHWIGDWKTSTYKKAKVEGYKEQLKFYAWAYWREYGHIPMAWVYFNKVNKIFKFQFPLESIENVEKEILAVSESAQKRLTELDFDRRPSRTNCYFCPFKGVCSTDLLRESKAETYDVIFHLKKNKLLVEGSIPDIIHRRIEKVINYEVKNAHFIKQAMLAKGIHYDGIKRLYRRKDFGGETFIGYMHNIYSILKDFAHSTGKKIKLSVKDYRDQEVLKNTIKLKDKLIIPFEMYGFQKQAVDELIKHRWGIVEVGTGGGKTVIAAEAIRRLGLRTLFIIDNKDLLMQTKREYETMLGISCGIVGMGYREWKSPVILATIQTLSKYAKTFEDELAQIPVVMFDECLDGRTWIITKQGRKRLSYIVNNKWIGEVLSYNHLDNKFQWKQVLAHYKTRKNEYYKVIIQGRKKKTLIMTTDHKLLINDKYTKISNAKVGDTVYCNESTNLGSKWSAESIENRSGSNNPMWKGIRQNYHRITCAGNFKYEHQKIFCEYWKIKYIPSEYCIHHLDHNPKNNKIENLLLMAQHNHKMYHGHLDNSYITAEQLLQVERIKHFKNLKVKETKSIRTEVVRRLKEGKILSIEKVKKDKNFFDIEIEDNHNFFANGVLSSNCHIIASKSFETISKFLVNSKYRFGFSATAKRDDGNDNIIYAHTGAVVYKRKAQDLIQDGVLVDPTTIFYNYDSKSVVTDNWQSEYADGIVDNDHRNNTIKEIAEDYIKQGKQVMILTKMIRHGDWFKENIKGSELIYGKTGDDIRVELLDDFKKGKFKLLIGNLKIFNKGINIKNLDVIINASGNAGDVLTVQTIGRVLRINPGKTEAHYIDFMDAGEYLHKHSLSRIEALKNEDYKVEIRKYNRS